MILSSSHFDLNLPYWQDYFPYLKRLAGLDFPSCAQLNDLLPSGLCSMGGHPIRFVDSDQLVEDNYEHRIYTTGQVSTRPNSWHDLFNALVWMRFPNIKTAMNHLHYQAGTKQKSGSRGKLRDALTLFDECGVIVFSNEPSLLENLSRRLWSATFHDVDFNSSAGVSICGHAILEKYLKPYKAMTAKAILIHVPSDFLLLTREQMLSDLDRQLADGMLYGDLLTKPARLSPVPLAGIPGWWSRDEQSDSRFYDDLKVFRPAPTSFSPAPVLKFS